MPAKEGEKIIKFKNGSEIKTIPCNASVRSSRSELVYPTKFIQDFFPELWDNMPLYQKAMISLADRFNAVRNIHQLSKEKVTCLHCGKIFNRPKAYYIANRGAGKPIIELAGHIRQNCCSDECFYTYWKRVIRIVEIT